MEDRHPTPDQILADPMAPLVRQIVGKMSLDDAMLLLSQAEAARLPKLAVRIEKFLSRLDRSERNTWLLALVNATSKDLVNLAYEQIYSTEIPQLRKFLASRGLEQQADEALDFAVGKLLQKPHSVQNFRAWMTQVSLRQAALLKNRSHDPMSSMDDEEVGVDDWQRQQAEEDAQLHIEWIHKCRQKVCSAEENRILDLYYFEEKSGAEISNALNLPLSTVYHRKSEAEKKIRLCVEGGNR